MQQPMFTETIQIAIVVRDLDATIRRYVEDFGIGPWESHEIDSRDVKELREYGQPIEHAWRVAVTNIGTVMWELIQAGSRLGAKGGATTWRPVPARAWAADGSGGTPAQSSAPSGG